MDICNNVSVSGEFSTLDDLFATHNKEVDFGMEWLSVFVEECFSSKPSCIIAPSSSNVQIQTTTCTNTKPSNTMQKTQQQNQSYLQNFVVPGKARSKRKRLSAPRTKIWSHNSHILSDAMSLDPPLLKQSYWLADSELIAPKMKNEQKVVAVARRDTSIYQKKKRVKLEIKIENSDDKNNCDDDEHVPNARRCTHCLSQRTPQWRAGPLGPKTLCNACGVRYKSGRLLPEYRPAKSPTFVSYLHSNSHKKVLEMRMQSIN
jgi:hypothetical protein